MSTFAVKQTQRYLSQSNLRQAFPSPL